MRRDKMDADYLAFALLICSADLSAERVMRARGPVCLCIEHASSAINAPLAVQVGCI